MRMIFPILVFIIFIAIPFLLMFYSLNKSGKICKQVAFEQPDFFDIKARYKFMTKLNNTQFISYIVSGKYKALKNPELIRICRKIRWIYIISAIMFFGFIGSVVLYSALTS